MHMFSNVMISFADYNSLYLILTHVLVKTALFITLLVSQHQDCTHGFVRVALCLICLHKK